MASEGLIRQVLETKSYTASDLEALKVLADAVKSGEVEREARCESVIATLMSSSR